MSVKNKSKKQKFIIGIVGIVIAVILILKGEDKSISQDPVINHENVVEETAPSNEESPIEEAPTLNEQQILEAIKSYIIETLHNGEKGTVYSIQFDKLEQLASDMPIEARTTEVIGLLENNQENIYQITMNTELAYTQNEYRVEYRQEVERILLSSKEMPQEENILDGSIKQLRGLIDGKYEVVLDMSELKEEAYGATSFKGYYTRYPDNIYEIIAVPNELNDLVLEEYFEGQNTGHYVLNREGNRFIGIFRNGSTNDMYDVVLEIEK